MRTLSVLTWNIQGDANITGYTSPKKIRPYLSENLADIVSLQECCSPAQLLDGTEILKTHTLVTSPLKAQGQTAYNDNAILTKFPVVQSSDVVFPDFGQKRPAENALLVDLQIDGHTVRVYNCHFPIFRAGPSLRVKCLEHIINHSKTHNGPVIICGDLNTTVPKPGLKRFIVRTWHQKPNHEFVINGTHLATDERHIIHETLQSHGFEETADIETPTWSFIKTEAWETGRFKLDWLMVKGMNIINRKLGPYISDHRPIEAVVTIPL